MTNQDSSKFMSSVGLVPSTIFDRVNADMDVSEEMEEIREILYEMIKKNFPMGVSSTHLAEKYREEFVNKGLGRDLPEDWLVQVVAAEEFEAQTRGPITILFVRLSNTSSFKRPPISSVNVRLVRADHEPTAAELKAMKTRKETEPVEHAKTLAVFSPSLKNGCQVSIVAFDSCTRLFLRATADDASFQNINTSLADIYRHEISSSLDSRVLIYEIVADGAYALRDSTGSWFRVIVQEPPHNGQVKCFFVDVGVCEKYPVNALRLLPPPNHPIMTIAALAREATLELGEIDAKSRRQLNEALPDLIFDRHVERANLVNLVPKTLQLDSLDERDGSCVVELSDSMGRSIADELLASVGKGPSTPSIITSSNYVSSQPTNVTVPTPSLSCCFDKPTSIEPIEFKQMSTTPFPANALFAAGPMDISLRQLSLDPMPDYMYSKLREECALPEAQLTDAPQVGSFYAALIDERWERVQCLRASKIDKMAFCVYLLDVGAFHYVRREAMRRLNSMSPFKKMLMFKCRISGIRPVGDKDVWSRESHEAVREFFEAACGEPVVVEVTGSWQQWKQLQAPAVPVCDARLSCCGRDLGDWLVACGLALPDISILN